MTDIDREMKWDRRFLEMAAFVSRWSKDPSTQCGAVIVRPDNTIASLGFNGFPRGLRDDPHLYEDRSLKYPRVIHAELNAILSAREPVRGYTLYTFPAGLAPTCDRCAVHVIQAGIGRVVHFKEDTPMSRRWNPELSLALYKEAGIPVASYVPPDPWAELARRQIKERFTYGQELTAEEAGRYSQGPEWYVRHLQGQRPGCAGTQGRDARPPRLGEATGNHEGGPGSSDPQDEPDRHG